MPYKNIGNGTPCTRFIHAVWLQALLNDAHSSIAQTDRPVLERPIANRSLRVISLLITTHHVPFRNPDRWPFGIRPHFHYHVINLPGRIYKSNYKPPPLDRAIRATPRKAIHRALWEWNASRHVYIFTWTGSMRVQGSRPLDGHKRINKPRIYVGALCVSLVHTGAS